MAIYCMSDIHGQFELFKKMLKEIKFSDEDYLYVIGDVIDRGSQGIDCLRFILDHPQMQLILGNHEKMMIDVLSGEKYQLASAIKRWNRNGNQPTLDSFCLLSQDEQVHLINQIKHLPLYLNVVVNDTTFYLVHGAPYLVSREAFVKFDDRDYEDHFVWERFEANTEFFDDKIVIVGHTPTAYYQPKIPLTIWRGDHVIDIDCGCAMLEEGGQLGCLCLDNMQEFYIEA